MIMALLLAAVGAFAGVLAGLLGVGGGIVLVPAFYYVFRALGFDAPDVMQVCVATSLATIVVTSIRSVQSHHRKGAVDWAILRGWSPFIAVGAVGGMLAAAVTSGEALQAIFAVLAMTVALYMGLGRSHWRLAQEMPGTAGRLSYGPGIGFLSVLMGIGGGSFGVPFMSLHNVPIHRAVATAAGFGLAIAVPSVIGFLFAPVEGAPPYTLGSVNGPAFVIIVAMTLITTPYGAALAHRLDPGPLKKVFAVFLFLVAVNMGWEALT